VKDRKNLLSIYLIKSCLHRLTRLRNQLNERVNIFNATPEAWNHVINSTWFDNFNKYCQYLLTCCDVFYKSELVVFRNSIQSFDEQQIQLMLYNLGEGLDIPPNDKGLALDLIKYAGMLLHQPDRDSKILSNECILAIKIDNFKYDFGRHLKERAHMDPSTL
jgi:hypothetical protein